MLLNQIQVLIRQDYHLPQLLLEFLINGLILMWDMFRFVEKLIKAIKCNKVKIMQFK